MKRENIKIEGHKGTWYIIGETSIYGKRLFLLEHEQYGEDAPCLIVDENLQLILEDVFNGFQDYEEEIANK